MASRRMLKVASAIREVVSMAILTQLRDPRVQDVTVTFVEVSSDLRHAKVHVSIMGDEKKQELSLRGLKASAGFLQAMLNKRLDMRYIPKLDFVIDPGVKHSIEVARILKEVLPTDEANETESDEDESSEIAEDFDDEFSADEEEDGVDDEDGDQTEPH